MEEINMKKYVFLFLVTLMTSGITQAANLYGEWKGKRYDIYLNDSSENIYGSYGDERADFYVRKSSQNVFGSLPCGRVDFYYRTSSKNAFGTICGERFDVYYDTQEEVLEFASDFVLSIIVDEFPRPVKSAVRKFITQKIKF